MEKLFVHSGINLEQDEEARKEVQDAFSSLQPFKVEKWVSGKSGKEKEKAEHVYYITRLIFALGSYDIWVEEEKGEKRVTLAELLKRVLKTDYNTPLLEANLNVQKALDVLRVVSQKLEKADLKEPNPYKKPSQKRSNWYRTLQVDGKCEDNVPSIIYIAKRIIDLCYNVSVESGISGVRLPYMMNSDKTEKQNLTTEEIRELQRSYVFEKLADDLDPPLSTLQFPPWKDTLELIEETGNKNESLDKKVKSRTIQYTIIGIIEVLLMLFLHICIFPCIDALLTSVVLSDIWVVRIIFAVLSIYISDLIAVKADNCLIQAYNYIFSKFRNDAAPVNCVGLSLLGKAFIIPFQAVQMKNYLERAGWFTRHFIRNRTKNL